MILLDVSNSSFVQFQIWDFPGQIDFLDSTFDSDMIFSGCGALIYVIDAQASVSLSYFIIKYEIYSNFNYYLIKRMIMMKHFKNYKLLLLELMKLIQILHLKFLFIK